MTTDETVASVHSLASETGDAGFALRLKVLIGEHRSLRAFAAKVGIGDTVIRKYLAGATPGIDKAVAIADRANVDLKWLISGRGEMRPAAPATSGSPEAPDASKRLVDERVFSQLREAGDLTRDAFAKVGWQPPLAIHEALKTLVYIYKIDLSDLVDAIGMIKSDWDGRS